MTENNHTKLIPLSQGKSAIIDAEDFNYLNQWKWRYNNGYAVRGVYLGKIDGKRKDKTIYMHRLVNNTPKSLITDHINMDRLDNRKANLRNCTRIQNNRNTKSKGGTSKYKGVCWLKRDKKWIATITVDLKSIFLGLYKDEIEAALVYNEAATRYHKEFAYLNKV